MKTTILALAAVATLGMAVPAPPKGAKAAHHAAPRSKGQLQDFSSSHRHHWRHNGMAPAPSALHPFWRHGRRSPSAVNFAKRQTNEWPRA